jgi:hypothetical protein
MTFSHTIQYGVSSFTLPLHGVVTTAIRMYSGRKINRSFGCVTVQRGRMMEMTGGLEGGRQDERESVCACIVQLKTFFPFNFCTIGSILLYWFFHYTLYSVNQRNCKWLALQTRAVTCTRYFYSLNFVIPHSIGLCCLFKCAFALRPFPHLTYVCNGQRSSELFCVY